ncbi:hypothetical protein V8E51_003048 [Hyaloscypha variabilis]
MPITASGKAILMMPKEYRGWMSTKRKAAQVAGIWDTCNPDLSLDKIMVIQKPAIPSPTTVRQGRVTETRIRTASPITRPARLGDLTEDEKADLAFQRLTYQDDMRTYEREFKATGELVNDIASAIDSEFLEQLDDTDTAYELLEAVVTAEWDALQSAPDSREVEQWVMKWQNLFKEGSDLKLPAMMERRAVRTFLNVLEKTFTQRFASGIKTDPTNKSINMTFAEVTKRFLT